MPLRPCAVSDKCARPLTLRSISKNSMLTSSLLRTFRCPSTPTRSVSLSQPWRCGRPLSPRSSPTSPKIVSGTILPFYYALRFSFFVVYGPATFPLSDAHRHSQLRYTPGRSDTFVKAITLANWANHLIRAILLYAFDDDGNKCGRELLLTHELFEKIRATVISGKTAPSSRPSSFLTAPFSSEIHVKGLCRTGRANKQYWGQREILLLIQHALAISQHTRADERVVKLQLISIILIMFYVAARPGSLAPNCTEMLTRSQYCKVGDITFKKSTASGYDSSVSINIENWKVPLSLLMSHQI